MKRTFILSLALAAAMLTACNKDAGQDASSAEESESSYTTGSYQIHFSESLAERGTETEPEPETEADTSVPKGDVFVHEGLTYRILDLDNINPDSENIFGSRRFFNGDILCELYNVKESEEVYSGELRFYNINEGTFEKSIPIPMDWDFYGFMGGGYGTVLCKVIIYTYVNKGAEDGLIEKDSVLTVYNDYTYDISDYTLENAAVERNGHMISDWELDLVCLDGEPEVIVPGSYREDDEYGFYTQTKNYKFPIDENRFVYTTGGYESMPGFGVYDFNTGTARDVPDSRDLLPLGVHDGKIYSEKTAWDGYGGSEIFVTDMETLETSFFTEFPEEFRLNETIFYLMPESGSYIIGVKEYEYNSTIYRVDPDTGNFTVICELPEGYYIHGGGPFIDDNTFVMASGENLIIFTMPREYFPSESEKDEIRSLLGDCKEFFYGYTECKVVKDHVDRNSTAVINEILDNGMYKGMMDSSTGYEVIDGDVVSMADLKEKMSPLFTDKMMEEGMELHQCYFEKDGKLYLREGAGDNGGVLGTDEIYVSSVGEVDEDTLILYFTAFGAGENWDTDYDLIHNFTIQLKRTDNGFKVDECDFVARSYIAWIYSQKNDIFKNLK